MTKKSTGRRGGITNDEVDGEMLKILVVNIAVFGLFFSLGCEPQSEPVTFSRGDNLLGYSAEKVNIIGLTDITPDEYGQGAKIKAYVDLLDSAGSRVKSPGRFRFELYDFVPRSSQRTGKRLFIWPDIDLTGMERNNAYWRDHLRAYQFELELDSVSGGRDVFILQVTYITAAGKRVSDEFQLRY